MKTKFKKNAMPWKVCEFKPLMERMHEQVLLTHLMWTQIKVYNYSL